MSDAMRTHGCWKVEPDQAGTALSRLIRTVQPGLTWSQIHRLVESRRVTVNGTICSDGGRRLQAGDSVVLTKAPLPPPPQVTDVRLIHVDGSIVVISKPAGMISLRHAAQMDWPALKRSKEPTADEAILNQLGRRFRPPRRLANLTAGERRKFIRSVHRLDRETSGLLVFARTGPAHQSLVRQFTEHTVERVYQAVVAGTPSAGTVESRFVRDRGDGLRGSVPSLQDGKRAVTHIRPLDTFRDFSLVECRLETGRTHQIRIHLAEQGHPVCGDKVYRHAFGSAVIEDRSDAPRLALHAHRLTFHHPESGRRMEFEVPLPADLTALIERLRNSN